MKAELNVDPVPDLGAGAQAFSRDLPRVLKGAELSEIGWCKADDWTLYVPMWGKRDTGLVDHYLVRLGFMFYPKWPPSAQFVNPKTLSFRGVEDKTWLPHIEGTNEIAVHEDYRRDPNDAPIQLICCSAALEFYQVRHSVNDEHIWDGDKQTFAFTLSAIRYALRLPHYKGPKEARSVE